jgi:hypothetical protein
VLLAHLVYHQRHHHHHYHHHDGNATTVLYTYMDLYIVGLGSIFLQSGVCGEHIGAVLALMSDHPHPALDKTTHAIWH